MSAFTTVVSRLGELSESELRQLHLIVGVRLGIPDGLSTRGGRGASSSNKRGKGKGASPNPQAKGRRPASKGNPSRSGRKAPSKGNPSRKSQWETHPLYREYKRLKKVVETQAKEKKISFAVVDSPEREAYNLALSQWLGAKHSFRRYSGDKKESADAKSADKGKGKAVTRQPTEVSSVVPSGTGKAGPASWADMAREAEEASSSSSEDEKTRRASGVKPTSKSSRRAGGKSSPRARSSAPKRGGRTSE
jgi:hypothetical protein